MFNNIATLLILCVVAVTVKSDPGTYYNNIDPTATNETMLAQLKALINPHQVLSYDAIWGAFKAIDSNDQPECSLSSEIKGIYSRYCWNATDQCGNYKTEGDCYNREHSWPKSWWGGMDEGHNAQTDLFHIYPADGYVNAERSNYALGYVSSATYTSTDGAKLGKCVDFTGTCFEPSDEYKGELARGYFYISTCYRDIFTCCDEDGVDKWTIKSWMETTLRQWHHQFPPSDREVRRCDLIYSDYQKNRNPFIDHPEWVDQIGDF